MSELHSIKYFAFEFSYYEKIINTFIYTFNKVLSNVIIYIMNFDLCMVNML